MLWNGWEAIEQQNGHWRKSKQIDHVKTIDPDKTVLPKNEEQSAQPEQNDTSPPSTIFCVATKSGHGIRNGHREGERQNPETPLAEHGETFQTGRLIVIARD